MGKKLLPDKLHGNPLLDCSVASVARSASPRYDIGTMEAALKTEKLCKSFVRPERTIDVLQCIDFELPHGKFVALTGKSGCGKTTLLQLLGALDKPTSGKILCNNQDVTAMGVFAKARFRLREIGFVFQSYQLMPELSAKENLVLAGRLGDDSMRNVRERADQLLERVDMSDRAKHRPAELSGGEQQRIAIARALMNNPNIILADEPTGNLDASNSSGIMDLLRDLCKQDGKSILMVTHSPELAQQVDLSFFLDKGKLRRGKTT